MAIPATPEPAARVEWARYSELVETCARVFGMRSRVPLLFHRLPLFCRAASSRGTFGIPGCLSYAMFVCRNIVLGACLAALTAGLTVAPAPSIAQAASAPRVSPAEPDSKLAGRVRAALDADPYFYAEHTEVTIENGAVVLTGIVWDNRAMFDAIDIAKRAAPGRKIINHLSIVKASRH